MNNAVHIALFLILHTCMLMEIGPIPILFISASLLGLVLSVALVFFNMNQRHISRLLAVYILMLSLFCIQNFLTDSTLIRKVPYLFRMTKPLLYLPGVLVFLYIRATLFGEQRSRKYDLLWFLPALIHFVEMIPFYIVDPATKSLQVEIFLSNMNMGIHQKEGILPPKVHPVLILLYNFGMLFISGRMLLKGGTEGRYVNIRHNEMLLRWLFLFFSFNVIIVLTFMIHWFSVGKPPAYNLYIMNTVEAALILFITAVIIFFNPNILYGFQGRMPLQESTPSDQSLAAERTGNMDHCIIISDDQKAGYLSRIVDELKNSKPFLRVGYGLSDISAATNIPVGFVSSVINQEYGMNFNEYVNHCRVEYVKDLIGNPETVDLTMETLARSSGFSSIHAFSNAFSKQEGSAPLEYIRIQQRISGKKP
jgi:AraC-like DNA-binding protein